MEQTPPDRDLKLRRFRAQFSDGVGFIENEGGNLVQLIYAMGSWYAHDRLLEKLGRKPGEEIFLVAWIPVGWQPVLEANNAIFIRTERTPVEVVLSREDQTTFPLVFEGTPVHYRQFELKGVPVG